MLGCKESFGGEGFVETGSGIKREVWEGESGVGGEGAGGCLGGGEYGSKKSEVLGRILEKAGFDGEERRQILGVTE